VPNEVIFYAGFSELPKISVVMLFVDILTYIQVFCCGLAEVWSPWHFGAIFNFIVLCVARED